MIQDINVKKITDGLFENIQRNLFEQEIKKYTKLKCQELLQIIAEKALIREVFVSPVNGVETVRTSYAFGFDNTEYNIDKDSILDAVNLDEFIV